MVTYILWSGAAVLGNSLIYLYFRNAGVGETDLLVSVLFWFLAPLLAIVALNGRKTGFRLLMVLGVAAQLASFILLALLSPTKELLFLYSFLAGTTCFLFWVPFNIWYFEPSHGKEAFLGTVYFSMGPFLSLALPVIGASIAEKAGFGTLFLATAAGYAATLASVFFLRSRTHVHDLAACLKELKGFKTLIFVEGVYGGGTFAAISVISLIYFTKPVELGVFLSVTTIFSIIASALVSRISDATRKRRKYINASTGALGIVYVLATAVGNATGWYAFVSLRNFFSTLFYPFTTAMIVDNKRDMARSMVSREWVLNIGRCLGVLIVLFSAAALSNIYLSLAVLGFFILAYPVVIELKKRHIRVE